jgi:hypothetical protein
MIGMTDRHSQGIGGIPARCAAESEQGFYCRGIKGRREFHAQELGDLFGEMFVWHGGFL